MPTATNNLSGFEKAEDSSASSPQTFHHTPWWAEYEFSLDETRSLHLGPLQLWLQRQADEWRTYTVRGKDPFAPNFVALAPDAIAEIPSDATCRRFAFGQSPERIRLAPKMPDRPMVVRPDALLSVPPGATIELFVTHPLWLELVFGHPPVARESIAVFQSTESWFGPSAAEGELCYASRSSLQTEFTQLVLRPHRVISKLRIHNRGDSSLDIERIKIPLGHLSIFADENALLWTETVSLVRGDTNELTSMRILEGPPEQAKNAERLCVPELRSDTNLMERAIHALFFT